MRRIDTAAQQVPAATVVMNVLAGLQAAVNSVVAGSRCSAGEFAEDVERAATVSLCAAAMRPAHRADERAGR
jgi:hypothetical protein